MNHDHPGLAKAKRFVKQLLGRDLWIWPQIRVETIFLGSRYGGYAICDRGLNHESIVYSFGLGEDISFDLAVIEHYRATVHAYDPTPKAMAWLQQQSLPQKFKFHPLGLADHDGHAHFAQPRREGNVSFSIARHPLDPQGGIMAEVARLTTLMQRNEHHHCDLLKMDVEGAEYGVLENILETGCSIGQMVLEFHPEMIPNGLQRTRDLLKRMNREGYSIFAISPDGRNFSLLRPQSFQS
ncbi:MAG: FkbM family methyltransferase [Magnetococcales bacterium]|nr:FkbM family methyltransferase [Magnetococcales bacterium]MBF0148576.1 FkbM family methyltransferase [Magnetococcales bacterium]MBF0172294.1 FkbM family methyltransferase [Magnetococcales bacterium]MBF0629731.1 FkbM family methyltransferase [Magnetococcales bacterium]